ncbi:hypothetical protein OTU49_006742 [Cherax quadricarinatus]|uniref:Uncharacterized protein n=1 Tax=Cherax quadricarinatus TaxID=27406 RepID=A0AAW0X067_CHEQU
MNRILFACVGFCILMCVKVLFDRHVDDLLLKRDVIHKFVYRLRTDNLFWGENAGMYEPSQECSFLRVNIPIVSNVWRLQCLQKEIGVLKQTLYQLLITSVYTSICKMVTIIVVGMVLTVALVVLRYWIIVTPSEDEGSIQSETEEEYYDAEDGVLSDTEDDVLSDTEDVYYDIEDGVLSDIEDGVLSDTEDGVHSDTEDGVHSDTEDGVHSDTEDGTHSDTEDGADSNTEDGIHSDTEDGVHSDTKDGVLSDTEDGVHSSTEDALPQLNVTILSLSSASKHLCVETLPTPLHLRLTTFQSFMKTNKCDDEVIMTAALVLARLVKKAVNQGWAFRPDWTQNLYVSVWNKSREIIIHVINSAYQPGSSESYYDPQDGVSISVLVSYLLIMIDTYGLQLMARPSRKLEKTVKRKCGEAFGVNRIERLCGVLDPWEWGEVLGVDRLEKLCRVLKHVSISRSSHLCCISKKLKQFGSKIQHKLRSRSTNDR